MKYTLRKDEGGGRIRYGISAKNYEYFLYRLYKKGGFLMRLRDWHGTCFI